MISDAAEEASRESLRSSSGPRSGSFGCLLGPSWVALELSWAVLVPLGLFWGSSGASGAL
eukprot:5067316-Pyramimonas_sp.AAC.1